MAEQAPATPPLPLVQLLLVSSPPFRCQERALIGQSVGSCSLEEFSLRTHTRVRIARCSSGLKRHFYARGSSSLDSPPPPRQFVCVFARLKQETAPHQQRRQATKYLPLAIVSSTRVAASRFPSAPPLKALEPLSFSLVRYSGVAWRGV